MSTIVARTASQRIASRGIPWTRVGAGLALVTCAYYYSLATLVRGLGLDTPLGYLGLVPLISLILMATRALAPHAELDIHDRYVDYIIGVSLLMAALATLVVAPLSLSTFYWQWRIDLLSLPLFVGGTISIVFGLRALWRVRLAVLFLFLAWPLPYMVLVNGQLHAFTNLTLSLVRGILRVVPLAQPLASSDGSLFSVPASGSAFVVSVSAAGSGVNGMVGFLLVGAAFASLVRGRLLAKAVWFASGLSLIWVLDIARILTIFTAGHTLGERFALQVLHPAMGLLVVSLGVLGMIALLPLFKLHLVALSSAGARPAPNGRPAVKRARVALIIVAAAALVSAAADTRPQHFQLLAGDLGPPRLQAFDATSVHVVGWKSEVTDSYPGISHYFGNGATWERYLYYSQSAVGPDSSPWRSDSPITLDVITTRDLRTFARNGLEAGYRFSHVGILESSRVDLGGGVTGHAILSEINGVSNGAAVYWERPVQTPHGEQYERVILNITNLAGAAAQGQRLANSPYARVQLAIANALGLPYALPADPNATRARDFLVGFAHQLVLSMAGQSATAVGTA